MKHRVNLMENRNYSIDAVHGLMLSYMIILHTYGLSGVNQTKVSIAISILLFCFMPWFYFKAGMFYRPTRGEYLCKDLKRLLFPFVVFSIIGFLVYEFITPGKQFGYMIYILLHRGTVPGNEPLWFLFSLFSAKFLFSFLYKEKILLLIPLFAYLGLSMSNFPLPYYVLNVLAGTIFLGLGYWLKSLQYSKISMVVSGVLFAFLLTYLNSQVRMFDNSLKEGYRSLWMLESVCAIIVYNNLFRFFSKYSCINLIFLKPLVYVGRNAMGFYCLHWIIIEIVLYILVDFPSLYIFITCILLYTIIPFFNFLLRKVNIV